jgi:LCP family protein required for cell wall assembly
LNTISAFKIDGYAVADFEMFKTMVDSIGGVKVSVTAERAAEVTNHKGRYGNVVLEEGEYKLTGEQALAYCRIRKIDTTGSAPSAREPLFRQF